MLAEKDLWAENQEDANYHSAMPSDEMQRHSVSQLSLKKLTMTKEDAERYTHNLQLRSPDSVDAQRDVVTSQSNSTNSMDFGLDFNNLKQDESFQNKVKQKQLTCIIGYQEACIEVIIDHIIQKEGWKDLAISSLILKIPDKHWVQALIMRLLQRGANPSATDENNLTPLHHAVKEKNRGVCLKLLEHGALPDARDNDRSMPFTLAYNAEDDDIAAMLIKFMDNEKVRELYSFKETDAEFSLHYLLDKEMTKTVESLLNSMIDQKEDGTQTVYYTILEADKEGRDPNHKKFDSKSGLHKIAKIGDKNIVYNDVVRLLIRKKWKEFAGFRFIFNFLFFFSTLITMTFSAVVATNCSDPYVYDISALQIARIICEVWSLVMAFYTLFSEINQFRKQRVEYLKDVSNWVDLSSSILILLLLPLRVTHMNEQWFVFSAAYLLWTIRIVKYAPVFRYTGAYVRILWRILINDMFQFTMLFVFILLTFSGSLLLSLRGEGSLEQFSESSSFWSILFVGVRILIEAERIIEYTELQTMSLIIMVAFLFTICVVLLNILIAQLSDTYQNVQQDAQRGLEVSLALIVSKVESNSLLFWKVHRKKYFKPSETFDNVKDVLDKWECPPFNQMNKNIEDVWKSLDSQKMILRNFGNRLSRQENVLSQVKETLDRLAK